MELLRTIAYPPGGGGGAAAAKGCEAAVGRAAGGESRRKKAEEQPHQHAHPAAEVSRIITDPTTGKRYCRGKVLGKVMAAAGTRPSRAAERAAGDAGLRRDAGPRPSRRSQRVCGSEHPSRPRFIAAPCYKRNRACSWGEPAGATSVSHLGRGEPQGRPADGG